MGQVLKFQNFIHLGRSCRYEGGCNNISPRQDEFLFQIDSLPAMIDLKLWKNDPKSSGVKADINYRIIFEEK